MNINITAENGIFKITTEGVLPDLTPADLEKLNQYPNPKKVDNGELVWSAVDGNKDPWFELVDENWKTLHTFSSIEEFLDRLAA